MKLNRLFCLAILALSCGLMFGTSSGAADTDSRQSGGSTVALAGNHLLGVVDDFSLPSIDGKTVSLSKDVDVSYDVICFLGTECPLARVYGPRLEAMANDYRNQGVRFIGICSNVQDSMENLRQYAEDHGVTFAIAKDFDRNVALQMKASRTPEVLVVDRAGVVQYRGRIDNQYTPGATRNDATEFDLRNALDQLVAGEKVSNPKTKAVGCLISLPRRAVKPASGITFTNQVSRVLQKHCVECHRQGEIGPFALQDYEEIVGWADMMLEVIDDGRMPPWHATDAHAKFANARKMSDEEKQILRTWVDEGTPYGNASDLPEKKEYLSGWRLPKEPDVVFEMGKDAYKVPAEGTVEYQYYVVDTKFDEDKWVSAAQVIPGNTAVVHHCICFIRPPDDAIMNFRGQGLLAGYVPGQVLPNLPPGFARKIPAGSRIVFQMHYTPNGQEHEDKTKIGLVFADEKDITHEVFVVSGVDQEFEIPPNTKDFTVPAQFKSFPKNGYLLSITPHMHIRGKAFKMFVDYKDRGREVLMDVPSYDFNWQHDYELSEPFPLADVEGMSFEATFDNSADNPANPNPDEFVTWGDQTWEEMAVAFLTVAAPRGTADSTTDAAAEKAKAEERQRGAEEKAGEFATKYMAKFDGNEDQFLTRDEVPDAVALYSFWNFDDNGDRQLTYEEIKRHAVSRFYDRD